MKITVELDAGEVQQLLRILVTLLATGRPPEPAAQTEHQGPRPGA